MVTETYYAQNQYGRLLLLSYNFSGTQEEIDLQRRRLYNTDQNFRILMDYQDLLDRRKKQGIFGGILSWFDKPPIVKSLDHVVCDVTD